MDPAKYEFQSDFAKKYILLGKFHGHEQARQEIAAKFLIKQLRLRFGPLSTEVLVRIATASADQLDVVLERVLTATSLDEALASI